MEPDFDLFVIGGGINGCGIARDAAGRGLSVALAEMGDLGGATSSASTKLFHGGLRYLEYFEMRLVREALQERETLLQAMPHIARPMRFVLPVHSGMRFDNETPVSRILARVMPWMRGRRPAWLIRLGLALYDRLGGRKILPGTARVDLTQGPEGAPLKDRFQFAYEYSDCWVDDSRLVVLNARDAEAKGATILTRRKVSKAEVRDRLWHITLTDQITRARTTFTARMVVNAAGPWVADVLSGTLRQNTSAGVRLVRGSHIVTRKLFDHEKAYFLQGTDGRIIFAIPYQEDFTLIGTTDAEHSEPGETPLCTDAERDYLLSFANDYFQTQLSADDIVWTYSGVRPLYDDGATSATAATRDYVLEMHESAGAPVLSVFGGKITTYRRLAEDALSRIGSVLTVPKGPWTAGAPLPGGNFAHDGVQDLIDTLMSEHPFLDAEWAKRLVRAYGTEARAVLGGARCLSDMGRDFGATLTMREVAWLMEREYALTAEDILWRRTRLGLKVAPEKVADLEAYLADGDGWFDETKQAAP